MLFEKVTKEHIIQGIKDFEEKGLPKEFGPSSTYDVTFDNKKYPPKAKPNDDDLKQMYAYNYRWNCNHSMLLYPLTSNQKKVKGNYFIAEDDKKHSCELTFVEVIKEGKLNKDIGSEILKSF